jgi:hypothetical protein
MVIVPGMIFKGRQKFLGSDISEHLPHMAWPVKSEKVSSISVTGCVAVHGRGIEFDGSGMGVSSGML